MGALDGSTRGVNPNPTKPSHPLCKVQQKFDCIGGEGNRSKLTKGAPGNVEDLENLYRLIDQEAPCFFHSIVKARESSRNEREFQTRVTFHIDRFADRVGVNLLFREEYTLATGRADAVYNRLIIEYERPGSMRLDLNHRHTRHAINQLKQYIGDVATKDKHALDRLLGVAFDGSVMVFARYRNGHWYEEPPLEVNRHSVTRLLRSLVSLSSGRALIPENLVEDFGAQNIYSQRVTRALYAGLAGHTDDLTAKLYGQWQLFFSQVSGYGGKTTQFKKKKDLQKFARGMGLHPENTDPPRLFFAIHTYFSFLVKSIAKLVLERYAGGQLGTTPLTVLANLDGPALKRELEKLEKGGVFRTLGLGNLLEGDFFAWYLQAWSDEIGDALQLTLSRLAEYNPSTVEDDPFAARDLLKKLYHYLLPRELRHDLGEYYTPDWLAERVLTQLNEGLYIAPKGQRQVVDLFPSRRLLDPACGSGTFLVLAIRAIKEHALRQGVGASDTLEYILHCIVGIDLNPLAVMAARVNYLLAIADLLPYRRGPIIIPVYLADSILTPTEGSTLLEQGQRKLHTVVGDLPIPGSITSAEQISHLTDLLDEYISHGFSIGAFLDRACKDFHISKGGIDEEALRDLYSRLYELEEQGLDGVWARVLKNAFMPLFIGTFDYVAGNPPWINWKHLPNMYRQKTQPLWRYYDLFPHEGFKAILGGSNDDIAALMTYVACDRYLRDQGKLAFVITQTVFKTAEGGRGFRRFQLGDRDWLQVRHVDDMSTLKPFEGATNRTSVLLLKKGAKTRYPVPYTYWKKKKRGGLKYESTLEEVLDLTSRANFQALPIKEGDLTSPWLTARPGSLKALRRFTGRSAYQGRIGVKASAAGIFWFEKLADLPGGGIVARNMAEEGNLLVESITGEIESALMYPFLRGQDVTRWLAQPSCHILVTHLPKAGLNAIPVADMEREYPKTLGYLRHFDKTLMDTGLIRRFFTRKDKRGVSIPSGPFYSMFDIGTYTFSPFKVVVREISTSLVAAVTTTENGQPVIPGHKLILVAVSTLDEAHYLCAVLNSSLANCLLLSYAVTTQISTHIFEYIAIPKYDPKSQVHQELAKVSIAAQQAANRKDTGAIQLLDRQNDLLVSQMWGCTKREMDAILSSLQELLGPRLKQRK